MMCVIVEQVASMASIQISLHVCVCVWNNLCCDFWCGCFEINCSHRREGLTVYFVTVAAFGNITLWQERNAYYNCCCYY